MDFKPVENVARKDIAHVEAAGIQNGKDLSAQKRSWKSYFWDTWDKSPAVRPHQDPFVFAKLI